MSDRLKGQLDSEKKNLVLKNVLFSRSDDLTFLLDSFFLTSPSQQFRSHVCETINKADIKIK